MKIIHFIPSIDRTSGGTSSYIQLLANELAKEVELYIVTGVSKNPIELLHHVNVRHIPVSLSRPHVIKKAWIAILNKIHPDIVHINCCWMPQCAWTQKWAQQLGYKVILTPHGMLEPWIIKRNYWIKKVPALLLYQKQAIVKADYLHATAKSEKENLLKLGYNQKIEIIANGIEVDSISMKADWKRKNKILFLSRVHVKKGIEFLIEAASILKEELKDYQLIIAGEGDAGYITQLKEKAKVSGVSHLFDFSGGVYGDKKWELFREADLFVLPTYSENFGIVVAEALACGTPVMTTKGTPWNELETYHCGWWTEIGTTATVEALKQFLQQSEEDLKAMGNNGRKLVEEKYSSKKMADEMVKLYKKII